MHSIEFEEQGLQAPLQEGKKKQQMSYFTRNLLTVFLSLTVAAVSYAEEPKNASADHSQLFPGVQYSQEVVSGPIPARVYIVGIDLQQPGLRFAMTRPDPSKGMEYTAHLTSEYLTERHAQIAINAMYFLPFKGGKNGTGYYPHVGDPVNVSGAALVNGAQVAPVDTKTDERVNAMACFADARVTIVDGQQCPQGFTDGVAAGPRLLNKGEIVPCTLDYYVKTQPRTAFGISSDHKRAWIVVVDGRQPGSVGMTGLDLARIFQKLGASDAINFDGGGSSTLVVEGEDGKAHILNSVMQAGVVGMERPVANQLLIFVPHKDRSEVVPTHP